MIKSEDEEAVKSPMLVMKEHGIKIFEEVKEAIASLQDFKEVANRFNELGYKHYKLGVRTEHIEVYLVKMVLLHCYFRIIVFF